MFVSMRYLAHPGIAAFIAESLLVHHQPRYFFEYLFMVADTVPREQMEKNIVLKVLVELKQQLKPVNSVQAFKVLFDMIDVSSYCLYRYLFLLIQDVMESVVLLLFRGKFAHKQCKSGNRKMTSLEIAKMKHLPWTHGKWKTRNSSRPSIVHWTT